jgi:hypothetical protein
MIIGFLYFFYQQLHEPPHDADRFMLEDILKPDPKGEFTKSTFTGLI